MRIVHHTWSFDFGGIERLILDLAVEQRRNGLDVSVHTGRDGGRQEQLLDESGIPRSSAGLSKGSSFSPRSIAGMSKHFSAFDIIHLHSFTPAVALAAVLSGKTIVYTEHGNFAFGRRLRWTEKMNARMLRLFLNRVVPFISFNSDFTRGEARRRYGLERVRQEVIRNGIPFPQEVHGALPADVQIKLNGRFVVGTSSRLAGFKRVDRLVEAFSRFTIDKDDVVLLIVGDGPCRQVLERQVIEMELGDTVVFAGFAPQARAYQAAMHVCVFPSEGEPFGIAALETLALGKPTLVMADSGGLLEIIRPLEPQDIATDVDHLAGRLEYYYSIRDVETGSRERKEHAKKFDIAIMERRFYTIYKELLS